MKCCGDRRQTNYDQTVSMTRRMQWILSQVPLKRAGAEFATLLAAQDLGIGWTVLDERAWKTGRDGNGEGWARRARAAKLLTTWRSFEQATTKRWLWIQTTPLVSDVDAVEAMGVIPDRFLRNPSADVTLIASQDGPPLDLHGVTADWAHEQETVNTHGEAGRSLYVAFIVGSTLAVLAASGSSSSWDWPEVCVLAQRQAERL